MTAVVNTSPLIVLAKLRRLDLLPALYGGILIPQAVADEVLAKPGLVTPELQRLLDRPRVRAAQNRALVRTLTLNLGTGEAEAIAVVVETGDVLLVMDDADGRRVARGLGLPVTGVLGVLVEAKDRGLLSAVKPLLDALSDQGFWLSESLRRMVLDAVRE